MKIFVPITDEMLAAGVIPGEPVAYQTGIPLLSQLQTPPVEPQSNFSVRRSPISTPKSEATPALSSSTNLAGEVLG
jgi:hypothetical protein